MIRVGVGAKKNIRNVTTQTEYSNQMIKTFEEAQQFIYKHIDADPKKRFAGEFGLRRGAYLLKLIGDPQNQLKVIHIAGTSGKGSTAFYVSQLLEAQGLKVSLTISPHLVDIRERCQINNRLISKKDFVELLNEIIPSINKMRRTEFKSPSYFEIMMAMFFKISLNREVDYAVVETGLGGLYDASNTITRTDKICVLTKIGLDHTEILGDTLYKIAEQKAGIIQRSNHVLCIKQAKQAEEVISAKVKSKFGKIDYIRDNENIFNLKNIGDKIVFDFKFKNQEFDRVVLNTSAIYQAYNAGLAMATIVYLSRRDKFSIDRKEIYKRLENISFSGRMENFRLGNRSIIIDGAHNPQKMKSLCDSLRKIYSEKSVFLVAFRAGKDYKGMLKFLTPLASKIIITSYKMTTMDLAHSSEKPEDVEKFLKKTGFENTEIVYHSGQALDRLIGLKNRRSVITGSLYLLSTIYPSIKKKLG